MSKKALVLIGLAMLMNTTIALAKVGYNQDQLMQFLETNQCPGCDLSNAGLYGNHSQANLDKANLSGVTAVNMNLSEAALTNANMTNIHLGGTNLSQANFENSVLIGADLSNTNLYLANITEKQLAQASSVCGAILPDGSKGKC